MVLLEFIKYLCDILGRDNCTTKLQNLTTFKRGILICIARSKSLKLKLNLGPGWSDKRADREKEVERKAMTWDQVSGCTSRVRQS